MSGPSSMLLFGNNHQASNYFARYALPIIAVVLALQATWLVAPFVSLLPPFLTFFAAILVTAWYGGFLSAVLATVLSSLVIEFYFIPPVDSFSLKPADLGTFAVFAAEAITIAYGVAYLQQSRLYTVTRERQLQRLQELSSRLVRESSLDSMLEDVVTAAIELLEGDKGVIQLYDSQEHVLRLIKQIGFPDVFKTRFERIPIGSYTCGKAFERKERIIVENVAIDPQLSDAVPIFKEFGIVGAQSTPLFTPDGIVFGILSTYWSKPKRPSGIQLQLLDLYAHQAERILLVKRDEEMLRQANMKLERTITEKQGELADKDLKLRHLLSELVQTEERERRDLSLELHDSLAQLLAFARLKVSLLRQSLPDRTEKVERYLNEMDGVLTGSLEYTRTLMAELNPPNLERLGLPAALQWLAERMRQHELLVDLYVRCEPLSLPREKVVLLYRCVRELLTNVLKHAKVYRATVSLTVNVGTLQIVVEDQGAGFDESATQHRSGHHFGLHSIRDRVSEIGGRLEIASAVGRGCTVRLSVPLDDIPTVEQVRAASPRPPDRVSMTAPVDPNQGILPLSHS